MFINHIYRHAHESPERLAVVSRGERITYRRFAMNIEAIRNFLMRARLPQDGVIATVSHSLYWDWVMLLALRSLGRTTVSGNSWAVVEGLGIEDISRLACFSDQTTAVSQFRSARPGVIVVEVPRSLMEYSRSEQPPLPEGEGRFGDHIVYTSGTTGSYKKLLFRGQVTERFVSEDSYGLTGQYLTRDDMFFGYAFGPWTAVGYKTPLRCWYRGAAIVFEQRSDWASHFFEQPVTMTTFVPGLLDHFLKDGPRRDPAASRLKIQVGGGFLDADLAMKLIGEMNCDVMAAYGGTEFRTVLGNFVEGPEDVIWLKKTFDDGIEIVDEADRRVADGVEGIVRVRSGPTDPTEYIGDPETTAKHFRDGYFYPGDMAVRRADGRIRILGRVDDVLNLGGQKVAIASFETWARRALQVESLCAFNQQDGQGRNMLIVVVEGTKMPGRARLEAMASAIKDVPQIRFSLMGAFPRGDNGMMKVNSRKVLELVRATLKE